MVSTLAVSESFECTSLGLVMGVMHNKICTSVVVVVLNANCPVWVSDGVNSAISWVKEPELSGNFISWLADFNRPLSSSNLSCPVKNSASSHI